MANGPTMKISTKLPISLPQTPSDRESDAEYDESPTTERIKRRRVQVPNEELVQRNSECQDLWDRKMRDFGYTTFYVKVAVLMISWDSPFDDLKTEGEVNDLATVFRQKYNFEVCFLKLEEKPGKKTQVHLKRKLGDFVDDHDHEDTLLIIYYAGHGFVKDINPGQMELMGCRGPRESGKANKIFWNKVENLLDETSGDVLEIMDCCYAGDLGELKRGQPVFCNRSFEYIAATSAGHETNSPGETSFTSALIWALNQFSLPESHKIFTVTDLVKKVRECPDFPKDQVPVSSPRNIGKIDRMVLSPLPTNEEAIQARKNLSTEIGPLSSRYHVHLNFDFNGLPTPKAIEDLANELRNLRKRGLDVSRIRWQGIHSGITPVVLKAADQFYRPVRERQKSQASRTPSNTVSPTINIDKMNFVVPESSTSTSTTNSRQEDLQSASFHLKMFLSVLWVTMACAVVCVTAKSRIVILILTTIAAFISILSMILTRDTPEV